MAYHHNTSWGDISWISSQFNDDFECKTTPMSSKTHSLKKRSFKSKRKTTINPRTDIKNFLQPSKKNATNRSCEGGMKSFSESEVSEKRLSTLVSLGNTTSESNFSRVETVKFSPQIRDPDAHLPRAPSETSPPCLLNERSKSSNVSEKSGSEVASVKPLNGCPPFEETKMSHFGEKNSCIFLTTKKSDKKECKETKFPVNALADPSEILPQESESSLTQCNDVKKFKRKKSGDHISLEEKCAIDPQTGSEDSQMSSGESASSVPQCNDVTKRKKKEMTVPKRLKRKRTVDTQPESEPSQTYPNEKFSSPHHNERTEGKLMKLLDHDSSPNQIEDVLKKLNIQLFDKMVNSLNEDLDTVEKIKDLRIIIDWELSELHEGDTLKSLRENPTPKASKDRFSVQECEKIKMRWIHFCETYGFDREKPSVFFPNIVDRHFMTGPALCETLLNFLRFIGQDLPNRPLPSIRRKFIDIHSKFKQKGRYSENEDAVIVKLFKMSQRYKDNHRFLPVASNVLGRPHNSILKRLRVLRNLGFLPELSKSGRIKTEVPTMDLSELPLDLRKCIPHILEVSSCPTLKDVSMSNLSVKDWEIISQKCGLGQKELQLIWHMMLRPISCSDHPVNLLKLVRSTLIKLFKKKVDSFDCIDWHKLSKESRNVGPVFLFSLVCEMILTFVPEDFSSVQDCISYLCHQILPTLKIKNGREVFLIRLCGPGVTSPIDGSCD